MTGGLHIRILFLRAYNQPEIAASLYIADNIVEGLVEAGYEVIQMSPLPTRGVSKEIRQEYKRRKYEEKLDGRTKIYRFWMFREGNNPIGRAFRYLCISVVYFLRVMFLPNCALLIVESTPPTQGALAGIIKRLKGTPVIYIVQDIFPDSLVNTGLTRKNSLLWKIGRVIENFSYRNADRIVVISDSFKENILRKGALETKIEVIPNWVEEDSVIPIEKENNVLYSKYGIDPAKFTICYSGNIGHTQNLDMLLDVAEALRNNPDIQFVLIGDGACRKQVEDRVRTARMVNVKLLPFQSYELISHVFSLGDVGLVISKSGVGQNSVPSKTWGIMSAARPVLASFDLDSDLNRIIKAVNCGICVQAEDRNALLKAVLELYENRDKLEVYGKNGRAYIESNLSRNIGVSKYVKIVREVLSY